MTRQVAGSLGLGLWASLVLWPGSVGADPVTTWNENAAKAATAACLHISGNGLVEARMYAMVHAAVHDALNAIDRRYQPYAFDGSASATASVDAAVAAAARDVLVSVIGTLPESPDCQASGVAQANLSYTSALAAIPDGPDRVDGLSLGQAAAAAIIARRAGDGSAQNMFGFDFPEGTEPGEWRFTPDVPLAFGPLWGTVTPFILHRSSQFRPPPPYPLASARYAADYNEIQRLGGDGITTAHERTADQTEIGLFWAESSPLGWNRLTREVSGARGFDPWENARLFALLNLAMADGYIASWEAKYHYLFWRPVTAIRLGETDGNPRTVGDPDWTPLLTTPPIPDHDSGHAVQGGAAAEVLKLVFGTDDIAFTACSTKLPADSSCTDPTPVLRSYSSFSEAADENALSRIYIGFHFRKAVEDGTKHGRSIAAYAVHRFLKPLR